MRLLLISCALLALAACQKSPAPPTNETAPAADVGAAKGVDRSHKGQPAPDIKILDAMSIDMGSTTEVRELQDGQAMLVNLWASWCAPCVKELPTLQKLQHER